MMVKSMEMAEKEIRLLVVEMIGGGDGDGDVAGGGRDCNTGSKFPEFREFQKFRSLPVAPKIS